MAKKKATVYVEEDVLRAARVAAARAGTRDSEVVEAALRRYLGFELLDQIWARSDLDEDEAMALADEAKHATRV
jgi:hypothetical protein